eukprot:363939-Chlamydomonas_euryale.AAC.2
METAITATCLTAIAAARLAEVAAASPRRCPRFGDHCPRPGDWPACRLAAQVSTLLGSLPQARVPPRRAGVHALGLTAPGPVTGQRAASPRRCQRFGAHCPRPGDWPACRHTACELLLLPPPPWYPVVTIFPLKPEGP